MIDPRSSETTGYHLFLEPQPEVAEPLSLIITNLAREYGAPIFSPHVTLLARIPSSSEQEVIERAQVLATQLSPMTLTLGDADMRSSYFRALYFRISDDENLHAAHDKANEIFGLSDEVTYEPHLSLLYGNFDRESKERSARYINKPEPGSFLVDKIYVYETHGEVADWRKIAEIPLTDESMDAIDKS